MGGRADSEGLNGGRKGCGPGGREPYGGKVMTGVLNDLSELLDRAAIMTKMLLKRRME